MHFYKNHGKQILNMKGDLIVTHNKDVVSALSKSAGPSQVLNARFLPNVGELRFIDKLEVILIVVKFVFGEDKAAPLEDL